MDGLYYLISIIGVVLVIRWYIQNDRVGPTEPTHGLLAMPDPLQREDDKSPSNSDR